MPDGASHLCDQRLQQGGGAFAHTANGEAEAAAAALHDPVVRLVRVERLGEHGPDLQVDHAREGWERLQRRLTQQAGESAAYLLDDLLTRVRLPVLHDGVRVSAREGLLRPAAAPVEQRLPGAAEEPGARFSRRTHLKITASRSSQTVGSADLPFVDSSARS